MASAVGSAFRDNGFHDGIDGGAQRETGRALAERLGYHWRPTSAVRAASIIVNVTPVGMAGGPEERDSPFDAETIAAADTVSTWWRCRRRPR